MTDELTNEEAEASEGGPRTHWNWKRVTNEAKPLDYLVCVLSDAPTEDWPRTFTEVSAHATSIEAAKAVRKLLSDSDNTDKVYFVLNRTYGPITLVQKVERVTVKVSGIEAKHTRQRKATATAPTNGEAAPKAKRVRKSPASDAAAGTSVSASV